MPRARSSCANPIRHRRYIDGGTEGNGEGGMLVRAVFITNYRPRTGFMTPQKREEQRGPVCRLCFASSPFNPPQMFIFRPIIANFHYSGGGSMARHSAAVDGARRVFILGATCERTGFVISATTYLNSCNVPYHSF